MSLKLLNELSVSVEMSLSAIVKHSVVVLNSIVVLIAKQRYFVLFILAGMLYWLFVEIVQAGISQIFPVSDWHAYVLAMVIGWLPTTIWIFHRNQPNPKDSFSYLLYQQHIQEQRFDINDAENHIEHTPVYYDYRPKFQ